jgi:hypothetical protein
MKKLVMYVVFFCVFVLFVGQGLAGNSPFSKVHVVSYAGGQPTAEVIDLTICLETGVDTQNPQASNYVGRYEAIIEYLADGIYEMTNGANYLGAVRLFPEGRFWTACDVEWSISNSGPSAYTGYYTGHLSLYYSDLVLDANGNVTEDRREFPLKAASSLLHETMHYIYGLDDEYGESHIQSNKFRNDFSLSVDISSNEVVITRDNVNNGMSQVEFERMLENYIVGSYVVFFTINDVVTENPQLPTGLKEIDFKNPFYPLDVSKYHKISQVDRSQLQNGIFRFKLENFTFVDAGSPSWGMRQPWNSSSVPHSVSWNSQAYYVGANHMIDDCGEDPAFQWWNFSTPFNARASSAQGMGWRDVNGNTLSQWEVITQDPSNDLRFGIKPSWPRYHFRSLHSKMPKASDTYQTFTHINYDATTTWWDPTSITWKEGQSCGDLTAVELPWMQVELAGLTPNQIAAITRDHLDIIWMDEPSVEIKVVMDLSGSMANHNKLNQAKLAAKYVSGGFLSEDVNYNVSNVNVELIGFDDVVQVIPYNASPVNGTVLAEIYNAIDQLTTGGNTAMYDAVSLGLSNFSSNPQSLKLMYVISDGMDNASSKTLNDIIVEYQQAQVSIHTFGYGKDANKSVLGDMAQSTGGTFFDQEESLFLKIGGAVTTVLANAYNSQQSFSGGLGPQKVTEQVLNVPSTTNRLLIMMEHEGHLASHSVQVVTASGAEVTLLSSLDIVGDHTFARLEADLSGLSVTDFPLRLVSSSQNWDVRVLSQYNQRPDYSLQVELTPLGKIVYPQPVTLFARVMQNGMLDDGAQYTVSVVRPDGSVIHKQFTPGAKPMRYTFMDYNMGGTYAWEVKSSSANYSLVQNGQFVLEDYAVDDHPAPPEEVSEITPKIIYGGITNWEGDEDWFRMQGMEQQQSYTIHFTYVQGTAPPVFSVYSPSNLVTPLYTGTGNRAGESWILSLGTDWSLNGGYIKVHGLPEGSKWEVALHQSKSSNIPVGRFELDTDWSSPHTNLSQSPIAPSEGSFSLESTPGWRIISSRNVNTEELPLIASEIAIDVNIPETLVNPWWMGTIALKARVLSSNTEYTLGNAHNLKAIQGGWETYYFSVPQDLLNKMQEPHPDLVFDIEVNGPDALRLDNMRFVGELKWNTVAQWEQECPGIGCMAHLPLDLGPVNHSTTVVPYGDLYLQISEYPTDYLPQRVVIGISPEDGAPLTGTLEWNGQMISLNNWYEQIELPFDVAQPMLLRLYNVGDRPYRITWWADGQVPMIAYQ